MALFEWTLALLLGAVILTGLARRVGVPYPSLLAIAGAALAFAPAGPELEIEPDLALALFVAPALLDAAFDTSPRDLRRNVIPLASLVVVAVGLTTAAVAWVGWRLGGLPIAAAVALGAIVAPPDAAAAAADPARAPGREPPERRDGTPRLSHRGRGRRRHGHARTRRADHRADGGGKPDRGMAPRPALPARHRTRPRRGELHGAHVRRDV